MKPTCRKIRDQLAADGPKALASDEAAQQHVAACEGCFEFLESLSAIEDGLRELPPLDVPDDVVERLLARPEIATPAPLPDRRPSSSLVAALLRPRPLVWGSVAAALLIAVVAVGLRFRAPDSPSDPFVVASNEVTGGARPEGAVSEEAPAKEERLRSVGELADADMLEALDAPSAPQAVERKQIVKKKNAELDLLDRGSSDEEWLANEPDRQGAGSGGKDDANFRDEVEEAQRRDYKAEVSGVVGMSGGDTRERAGELAASPEPMPPPPPMRAVDPYLAGTGPVSDPVPVADSRVRPVYPEQARAERVEASVVVQLIVRADGSVDAPEVLRCSRGGLGFEQAAIDAVEQWRFEPAQQAGKPVDVYFTVTIEFSLDEITEPPPGPQGSVLPRDDSRRLARAFLEERDATAGLRFRKARGYWSNTYVPGDPLLRELRARLAGRDRATLDGGIAAARLHDAARPPGQPFDDPRVAALALYLHADRRGLDGAGRALVQVGIEGTPRHGGRRPAMNLALVIDLRGELVAEERVKLRALVDAFQRVREPGDRFRLFVAGRGGGCIVGPDEFRHGVLRIALDRLLSGAAPEAGRLGLAEAVSAAIASVADSDDPEAPLGSSVVILVAADPLGRAAERVSETARRGALAGIPLSVIGLGDDVVSEEIERIALAGQGSRRLLVRADEAAALVDRELAAAGRAVARAVRLRIRLAPGVRLVDVVGSERLGARRAKRVRAAERSLDLHLARSLGIGADRGEDEEGIQIVIPAFYAGDSHAILLDVVAPGAGPVADVQLRYKDLVHLRNGTARASLELGHESAPRGPLERNVLKNLLSHRLSDVLDRAGRALRADDAPAARAGLAAFERLLEGLCHEISGLDHDPDVASDLAMLREYRSLIASGSTGDPDRRDYLADSLRYAARLEILPPPTETPS